MRTYHFEDLDSNDFERLYYYILRASGLYKDIRPYGQMGCDDGVDIYCIEKDSELIHFVQCKREKSLSFGDLKRIVDKIATEKNDYKGQVVEVVASCNIRKEAYERYKRYAKEKGFSLAQFYGAIDLEEILDRKEYESVQNKFFHVGASLKERVINKLQESKKGKDLVTCKLIGDIAKESKDIKRLINEPSLKFKYGEVIIRSIYDTKYPEINDNCECSHFKSYLHDVYDDGIQLHIAFWIYESIVVNNIGEWMLREEFEREKNNGEIIELKVNVIGRVPFYSIIDIDEEGDSYYSYPIIFCDFESQESLFTEICYEYHNYQTHKRILFEKGKRAYISSYDFEILKKGQQVD